MDGDELPEVEESSYEPCGRLGPHEPHVWLSRPKRNCTGSGEPGRTSLTPPNVARRGD